MDFVTLSNAATLFNAAAAGLVIVSFVMKGMIRLRIMAAVSNVFNFVSAALSLSPIGIVEYCVSMPINLYRLREMLRLVKRVEKASTGDLSMDWLKPFMTRHAAKTGERIFGRGDAADRLFLIGSGRWLLPESGIEPTVGQVVGEIGLLTPGNARTQSFVCIEAGELFSISYEHVKELYYQNPEFGFYFLRLTSRRLLENIARLEAELAKRPPAAEAAGEPREATA